MNGNKIGYKEQNCRDSKGLAGYHNWSEKEPEKIPKHLGFFWILNIHLPLSSLKNFCSTSALQIIFPPIFRRMSASKVGS